MNMDDVNNYETAWLNLKAIIRMNVDVANALQSCKSHGDLPIMSERLTTAKNESMMLLWDAVEDMGFTMDTLLNIAMVNVDEEV